MSPFFFLAALAGAVLIAVIVLRMRRRRTLTTSQKREVRLHWERAVAIHDPTRRLLEADKVIDALLGHLRFLGSFGEKLKQAGPLLPHLDSVWSAHKLRNRIAHEPGFTVDDRTAATAIRAFERVVQQFL